MHFKPDVTEQEIVKGCLRNDRYSQKKLFDRYKDAMYTLIFRIVRDEAKSCDALQEGFIQVFSGLDSFRWKSTLGAWIKTIMIRRALRVVENKIQFEEYSKAANEIVEWDENLTGEMLDKAIAFLSPGYRSVFILVEVEGYSHKEVAAMLNISEGTSKSQLSRAKKILQEQLRNIGY